jgi:uncharacterized protein (DUF2141 family)
MGSISGFGIGFAVLTAALAISVTADAAGPANNELRVEVGELRNVRGKLHACLTQDPAYFPNCKADARALRVSVAASEASELRFDALQLGSYALSIIHDENGNGKLDTFARIPREGYGFSRNPPMRFGPPRFEEVKFDLASGRNRQVVRMRYLL